MHKRRRTAAGGVNPSTPRAQGLHAPQKCSSEPPAPCSVPPRQSAPSSSHVSFLLPTPEGTTPLSGSRTQARGGGTCNAPPTPRAHTPRPPRARPIRPPKGFPHLHVPGAARHVCTRPIRAAGHTRRTGERSMEGGSLRVERLERPQRLAPANCASATSAGAGVAAGESCLSDTPSRRTASQADAIRAHDCSSAIT